MEHPTLDLARLTPEATPAALAEWHRSHGVGEEIAVQGRWYGTVPFETIAAGAGASVVNATSGLGRAQWILRREETLPDLVAPLLRVLIVGLNPSVVAAESGIPFCGRTNRFWPAAIDAGLVPAHSDPWRAFTEAHVGFSDLVKRATPRANGLVRAEFVAGAERLREIVEWLAPRVVCFAGVTGYRRAVDSRAAIGVQDAGFGGATTYVMPNPSGSNAHATRADLMDHFERVGKLAG